MNGITSTHSTGKVTDTINFANNGLDVQLKFPHDNQILTGTLSKIELVSPSVGTAFIRLDNTNQELTIAVDSPNRASIKNIIPKSSENHEFRLTGDLFRDNINIFEGGSTVYLENRKSGNASVEEPQESKDPTGIHGSELSQSTGYSAPEANIPQTSNREISSGRENQDNVQTESENKSHVEDTLGILNNWALNQAEKALPPYRHFSNTVTNWVNQQVQQEIPERPNATFMSARFAPNPMEEPGTVTPESFDHYMSLADPSSNYVPMGTYTQRMNTVIENFTHDIRSDFANLPNDHQSMEAVETLIQSLNEARDQLSTWEEQFQDPLPPPPRRDTRSLQERWNDPF